MGERSGPRRGRRKTGQGQPLQPRRRAEKGVGSQPRLVTMSSTVTGISAGGGYGKGRAMQTVSGELVMEGGREGQGL